MPELPEVETIKQGLLKNIRGKTIKSVTVLLPKVVSLGPETVSNVRDNDQGKAKKFRELLRGRKILRIDRRSKMLMLDLAGGLTLLIHLKMTGQLIFAKKGEEKLVKIMNIENSKVLKLPHRYTHLIFEFTDGSRLFFNDLRQFGYAKLVETHHLEKVRELKEYGPEPFSADFSLKQLRAKAWRRKNLAIKQYLMDPKAVAGIGNIYSDEILYWSKIRPSRKLKDLSLGDWKKIHQTIPKVLKDAIRAHGSSVGDFFTVEGREGSYGRQHRVYGRAGEKCKKCGTLIKSVKLGGRTSSYCPKEQR